MSGFWLGLSLVLVFVGYGLQSEVLPLVLGQRYGGGPVLAAVLMLHSVGFYLAAVCASRLIRAWQRRRILAGCIGGLSVAPFVFCAWPYGFGAATARFLTGFCMALLYAAFDAWIGESSGRNKRGSALGFYSFLMCISMMLGAGLIHLNVVLREQEMPLLSGIIIGLASVTFLGVSTSYRSLALERECSERVESRKEPKPYGVMALVASVWRREPAAILGMLAMGTTVPFWDYGPLFARHAPTDSPVSVGVFVMCVTLGSLLGQWPVGKLSDLLGRRVVMQGCSLAGSLASIGLICLPATAIRAPEAYYVASFLYGLCTFQLYTLSMCLIFDCVEECGFRISDVQSWHIVLYGLGGLVAVCINLILTRLLSPHTYSSFLYLNAGSYLGIFLFLASFGGKAQLAGPVTVLVRSHRLCQKEVERRHDEDCKARSHEQT